MCYDYWRRYSRTLALSVTFLLPLEESADGLHAQPAGQHPAGQCPGEIFEFAIHFAVAAGKQESQDVVRHILHVVLWRIPDLRVGLPSIFDDRLVVQHDASGRDEDAAAAVPKSINE